MNRIQVNCVGVHTTNHSAINTSQRLPLFSAIVIIFMSFVFFIVHFQNTQSYLSFVYDNTISIATSVILWYKDDIPCLDTS